jgi:signal peptidase I
MALILILIGIIYFSTLAVYKSLVAAGVDSKKALIPFINTYEWVKVIGRPTYQAFVVYLPVFNFFLLFSFFTDFSRCFGRTSFGDYCKAMILPILHFSKIPSTNKYLGTLESLGKEVKSNGREWADSIVFAVLAATLIRWSTFEAFTIPTSSMEGTMLVGDYLFVSKLHYGPRSPITPLQVPLTHQTLWFTDKKGDGTSGIKSYLDWIQLPYFRFPGITEVKRNDIVVFNWPWDNGKDTYVDFGTLSKAEIRPIDLKMNYVKRCVGIPGDTVEIRNQQLYINGKPSNFDGVLQHQYRIYLKKDFVERSGSNLEQNILSICHDNEIRVESGTHPHDGMLYWFLQYDGKTNSFAVNLSKEKVQLLKSNPAVVDVKISLIRRGEPETRVEKPLYPVEKASTLDDYGPVVMPQKGMTIEVNRNNLIMFDRALSYFEGNNIEIKDNYQKLFVDGKEVQNYTFKNNYFYMIGDNRHGSYDSRTWAFVPENHIVGTPILIWLSMEDTPNKSFFERIRWDRLFKWVR